jgi:predicted nucleotidyltransferase
MYRRQVEERTILLALTGSRRYGLATEQSDYDYRGVFIATKPYYLGFDKIEQQDRGWVEGEGLFPDLTKDTCIYELRKFLELSAANNPNILELLWFKEYLHLTPVGQELVRHKHLFLSTKVRQTYSGYGYAQIRKLESHRKWLLDPPTQKPIPSDFGLDTVPPMTVPEINTFLEYLYNLIRERVEFLESSQELYELLTGKIDFKAVLKQYPLPEATIEYTRKLASTPKEFIDLLQRSHQYRLGLNNYKSYQDWKKNRNPARAAMEAKVGYDCKFAMQAIRLLRTGIEILETQNLIVDRREAGDAEQLLAIKRGDYTYEEVMKIANELYRGLGEAYSRSQLPKSVDREAVNQLCIDLVTKQGW